MTSLKAFLAKHNITTHSVVAFWGILTTLFYTNPAFKAYVLKGWSHVPNGLHEFVMSVVIPLALYWKSQKSSTPS